MLLIYLAENLSCWISLIKLFQFLWSAITGNDDSNGFTIAVQNLYTVDKIFLNILGIAFHHSSLKNDKTHL